MGWFFGLFFFLAGARRAVIGNFLFVLVFGFFMVVVVIFLVSTGFSLQHTGCLLQRVSLVVAHGL